MLRAKDPGSLATSFPQPPPHRRAELMHKKGFAVHLSHQPGMSHQLPSVCRWWVAGRAPGVSIWGQDPGASLSSHPPLPNPLGAHSDSLFSHAHSNSSYGKLPCAPVASPRCHNIPCGTLATSLCAHVTPQHLCAVLPPRHTHLCLPLALWAWPG